MRCLGIPNTKEFFEVTKIADAQKRTLFVLPRAFTVTHLSIVWAGITSRDGKAQPDQVEEHEDAEGNVYNKRTYEDLRQKQLV